jgi:hypothetical protein
LVALKLPFGCDKVAVKLLEVAGCW